MKSKDEVAKQFKKQKGISDKGLSKQWTNTRDCQAFYAGDFMSYTDRLQFADGRGNKKATMVQFNKVKPYVNAVRGFMAQNRRKAKYTARHPNEQLQEFYSNYKNAFADYVRDEANADQIETQQDGDLLICGYGAIETALTYGMGRSSTNPNGQIIMGRIDPQSVGWDSSARATNLLDARWVFYKKIYALDEAMELFDDARPQDFEQELNQQAGNKIYYKRGGTYNKIQEIYDWEEESEQLVKVYFYQWYDIENFYRAKNPLFTIEDPDNRSYIDMQMQIITQEQEEDSDDMFTFDPRAQIISCNEEVKNKLSKLFDDEIEFESFKRKVFYSAIVSGKKVFTVYKNSSQDGFTIQFKTGDFDESNKMWTGMVNSLRDPALYYNKALTELLWTIASQAKGGVLVERSAVEDIENFEAKYAKTDGVIIVEDGAVSQGKIKPKKEGYQPTGIEEILTESNNALPDVAGIDKSFLGSSENKLETATLQRQRIRQVTTTLATYFDAITLYQKENARILSKLMRVLADNNDGALFKALGEDGAIEYMVLSSDNFVDEYDITIQEAPDTATQKEETSQALFQVAQTLIQIDQSAARQIMAVAVKGMSIDFADRQAVIEALVPQGQQIDPAYVQQLEKQVQALMDEGRKAELSKKMSEANLNIMRGEEIISNIKSKNIENQRTQEETQAFLEGKSAKIAKEMTEAHMNVMKGEEMIANIHEKNANIGRTNAQTQQYLIENELIKNHRGGSDLDINA